LPLSVRDWSGILLKRSGKRYSGKPDGAAGTPKRKRLKANGERQKAKNKRKQNVSC
jgi:hypothetical protein